ncbi:hypothetical protein [Paenibacillus sp. 481]|uniref:hypothetical protein n=1 Tax=Paenibacillus sp. 481 TaxID=2835869 RepID=UPI001E312871|nr:hypothetical protein [Paenibacillus sp. 481]UHA74806.1 hypothetical protein KIK04_07030 [Paenibacillus sp. 481]
MSFVLDHKITFVIISELIAVLSLIAGFVLRYAFQQPRASTISFFVFIANDIWLLTIAAMDYNRTGQFSAFHFVIAAIVIYSLTLGKSDIRKLDYFIARQVASWKRQPMPDHITMPTPKYGMAYAQQEMIGFAIHLLVFVAAHIGFVLIAGLREPITMQIVTELSWQQLTSRDGLGWFKQDTLNQVSKVWSMVLAIDCIFSVSYLLFPKKEPSKQPHTLH